MPSLLTTEQVLSLPHRC